MKDRISKIILDLYTLQEDPLANMDKVPNLLEQLDMLGIESPALDKMQEYAPETHRVDKTLKSYKALEKCFERFLSEDIPIDRKLREAASQFRGRMYDLSRLFQKQYSSLRLKITQKNIKAIEQLISQLIGVRLEYELVPGLFKKMGFNEKTRTMKVDDNEIEVDGRFERETLKGAREDRLVRKEVIIVECKTTIDYSDIKKFDRKAKLLHDKYLAEKDIWNYKLSFEAWMVACYGWKDNLIQETKRRNIIPITPETLIKKLRAEKIHDRRIPICPNP